ncbi:MAG TPA: cytochrome P460 family protein [Acidobacteriaceae bacterium]
MFRPLAVVLCALLLSAGAPPKATSAPPPADLSYTADGQMNFPENYRQWVYLTSGLGMSYSTSAPDHPMFDNVFVNPTAYKAFLSTGTWPDKTVLVLEIRGADSKVSIDHHGQSQTPEVMGLEVHVRDEKLPGKWGFFEFDPGAKTGKIVPRPASCYTCHEAHGAVDTTFVQFYPTLIGLAKEKKTLSAAYLKEMPGTESTAGAKAKY